MMMMMMMMMMSHSNCNLYLSMRPFVIITCHAPRSNVLQLVTASVVFVCAASVCLQILNSFHISGTLYALQIWQNNGSLKGAKSGSRVPFKNFKPPSIFLELMKLASLNLASGSTTASPTQGSKNSTETGVIWVT